MIAKVSEMGLKRHGVWGRLLVVLATVQCLLVATTQSRSGGMAQTGLKRNHAASQTSPKNGHPPADVGYAVDNGSHGRAHQHESYHPERQRHDPEAGSNDISGEEEDEKSFSSDRPIIILPTSSPSSPSSPEHSSFSYPPLAPLPSPSQEKYFSGESGNVSRLIESLMKGYDKRLRPNYKGDPVQVGITMYVSSISSISEVNMDFTLDFYFRQHWRDERLTFENTGEDELCISNEMLDRIWWPDTFFANAKSAQFHTVTTKNAFLRIKPNGSITQSLRLSVTAMCTMDLRLFPMDIQICPLEIESYAYSVKHISYSWKDGPRYSVEIFDKLQLPQFKVEGYKAIDKIEKLSTGNYSRLACQLWFVRSLGYYIIQIYVPSSLIVVLSWVSFWLDRNAAPARVALGITTVLTLTTFISSTNAALPKISYLKSIDVYLVTCFIMVFSALLEYAAVSFIGNRPYIPSVKQCLQQQAAFHKERMCLNQKNNTPEGMRLALSGGASNARPNRCKLIQARNDEVLKMRSQTFIDRKTSNEEEQVWKSVDSEKQDSQHRQRNTSSLKRRKKDALISGNQLKRNKETLIDIESAESVEENVTTGKLDLDQFSLPEFNNATTSSNEVLTISRNTTTHSNARSTSQPSKNIVSSLSNKLAGKTEGAAAFQGTHEALKFCCCHHPFKETIVNRNVAKAEFIDRWSRVVFPCLFIVFIFTYWTIYTNISNMQMLKGFAVK